MAVGADLAGFLRTDPVAPSTRGRAQLPVGIRPHRVGDRPGQFAAWCEARTGYPIVDAAMRQINQTGYMHNRLRMIVASFLTGTRASTGGPRALLRGASERFHPSRPITAAGSGPHRPVATPSRGSASSIR